MYELMVHDEVTTYETRADAVKAAKDMTLGSDSRMTVSVSDGTETLSFRDGKLIAYTYETRRGDSPSSHQRELEEDAKSEGAEMIEE